MDKACLSERVANDEDADEEEDEDAAEKAATAAAVTEDVTVDETHIAAASTTAKLTRGSGRDQSAPLPVPSGIISRRRRGGGVHHLPSSSCRLVSTDSGTHDQDADDNISDFGAQSRVSYHAMDDDVDDRCNRRTSVGAESGYGSPFLLRATPLTTSPRLDYLHFTYTLQQNDSGDDGSVFEDHHPEQERSEADSVQQQRPLASGQSITERRRRFEANFLPPLDSDSERPPFQCANSFRSIGTQTVTYFGIDSEVDEDGLYYDSDADDDAFYQEGEDPSVQLQTPNVALPQVNLAEYYQRFGARPRNQNVPVAAVQPSPLQQPLPPSGTVQGGSPNASASPAPPNFQSVRRRDWNSEPGIHRQRLPNSVSEAPFEHSREHFATDRPRNRTRSVSFPPLQQPDDDILETGRQLRFIAAEWDESNRVRRAPRQNGTQNEFRVGQIPGEHRGFFAYLRSGWNYRAPWSILNVNLNLNLNFGLILNLRITDPLNSLRNANNRPSPVSTRSTSTQTNSRNHLHSDED